MVKKKSVRNAVLWTVAGAFALLGIIVFVAATGQTEKGEAIIENPGALFGIVITSLSSIMAILLPILLRAEKNTEIAKEQLQNEHKNADGTPLNIRDDLDDKHEVILTKLESLQGGVNMAIRLSEGNASDIRGMRRDVGRVQDTISENTREIARVSHLATGLINTVDALGATVKKNHPEGDSHV